ncbi:MAG: asparagine synthase-related protein [Verrucomicrobiota bacterium]|nr:asparagine synthase-related protein [Limisphaera sp.]MDW8380824.1 asparagine synthase-related protein [Verrucomicrobiota bacterium]
MPDFVLDLRPPERRRPPDVARSLRWSSQLRSHVWDTTTFRVTVTWTPPDDLWRPWTSTDGSWVAVVGFLALDEKDWDSVEQEMNSRGSRESGGLAGAYVWRRYCSGGVAAWEDLSGNCAILVYDAPRQTLYLRTDPAGCFPVFGCGAEGYPVWASHPDILAASLDKQHKVDEVSVAEFVMSSVVTPPHTYYQGIEAYEPGTVISLDLASGKMNRRRYFALEYQPLPDRNLDEVALALGTAWRRAVARRTVRRLGRVAIALSGGLDSRLVLACITEPRGALAFSCYDAPNREFRIARELATAVGVEFLPIRRSEEYYGEHAIGGVRISGGMGTFANNHFLGVLPVLQAAGCQALLTGCYCDYLFKGLPLNRRIRWYDGRETLAPYRHQFYFQRWEFNTALSQAARLRWERRFPAPLCQAQDEASLFQIEVLRTFPLYHEGDNQQRLVPQRLMAWSPPVTDLEILRVYQRTPSLWKLNRALFLKVARTLLSNSALLRIPDANTGAALDAPGWLECLTWQALRMARKVRALRPSLQSDGSWPKWDYYYRRSIVLERLWQESQSELDDLLLRILGWKALPNRPADFPPDQCFLFVALLTLRLWWKHRPSFDRPSGLESA